MAQELARQNDLFLDLREDMSNPQENRLECEDFQRRILSLHTKRCKEPSPMPE